MADYIHEGQGNWYLDLETGDTDLAIATDLKLRYIKPSGEKGFFPGTAVGTKMRYVFDDTTAPAESEIRRWRWQPTYKVGGRTSKGKEGSITIYESLD